MKLSAPTTLMFVISAVIAIVAALQALGSLSFLSVPSVWIMAIAYIVLAAGCLIRGA